MKLTRRNFIFFSISNLTIFFSILAHSSELRTVSKEEILRKILVKLKFKFDPINKNKLDNKNKKIVNIDNWIFKEEEIYRLF